MMTSTRPTLTIRAPEAWGILPLEREAYDATVAALRREWRKATNWDRTTERKAEFLLDRLRAEVLAARASFVAYFRDSFVFDDPDRAAHDAAPEPTEVIASMTCSVHTQADLGTGLALTHGVLLSALAARRDGPDHVHVTELEPVGYHQLPVGKTIRLRRLYELRDRQLTTMRFYNESFVFPFGSDGTAAAFIQFTTPNVELAASFSRLFERIASTAELHDSRAGDGDPESTSAGHTGGKDGGRQ